eukprot:TRINITY_DN339_c0_g1_i1.p1 TRINITY_DN339_c0_g1~~TRINITY_DN339_c0_g1_i1.p1  ORF type:complete len:226 (+),score=19.67 TRINITY_DN339_c0_g1_i1:44-721(+)
MAFCLRTVLAILCVYGALSLTAGFAISKQGGFSGTSLELNEIKLADQVSAGVCEPGKIVYTEANGHEFCILDNATPKWVSFNNFQQDTLFDCPGSTNKPVQKCEDIPNECLNAADHHYHFVNYTGGFTYKNKCIGEGFSTTPEDLEITVLTGSVNYVAAGNASYIHFFDPDPTVSLVEIKAPFAFTRMAGSVTFFVESGWHPDFNCQKTITLSPSKTCSGSYGGF